MKPSKLMFLSAFGWLAWGFCAVSIVAAILLSVRPAFDGVVGDLIENAPEASASGFLVYAVMGAVIGIACGRWLRQRRQAQEFENRGFETIPPR